MFLIGLYHEIVEGEIGSCFFSVVVFILMMHLSNITVTERMLGGSGKCFRKKLFMHLPCHTRLGGLSLKK